MPQSSTAADVRNSWSWGASDEDATERPSLTRIADDTFDAWHPTLGRMRFVADQQSGSRPAALFTSNETNQSRVLMKVHHLAGAERHGVSTVRTANRMRGMRPPDA
jgi:hypothetical protein